MPKTWPPKDSYHHGQLREVLLAVAEDELEERGTEGFSMRAVAARAGVSHAAPKRHFADLRALLTALAAHSFRQFTLHMQSALKELTPMEQLLGVSERYVEYANKHPALFELQFFSNLPDRTDPELLRASDAAFSLVSELSALAASAHKDEPVKARQHRARLIWAFTHGVATLQRRAGLGNKQDATLLLKSGLPGLLDTVSSSEDLTQSVSVE